MCGREMRSRIDRRKSWPQSAQRELNPRFRHGKAVGYRYIMGAGVTAELSKSSGAALRLTAMFSRTTGT